MEKNCDFSGWATKANIKCTDGRVIMKDAFKDNDGKKVPLVYNHQHDDIDNVLGHAILENREEGVYAYCFLNDSKSGMDAKRVVAHGDIESLSIFANNLIQRGTNVIHGNIREVSMVLAGANPEARIDSVIVHSDGYIEEAEDMAIIYNGESISLAHSDEEDDKSENNDVSGKDSNEPKQGDASKNGEDNETIEEVFNSMTDKQKNFVYALVDEALGEGNNSNRNTNKEDETMKHNAFDKGTTSENAICHSDEVRIIDLAKSSGVGTLQGAISSYLSDNTIKHGYEDIEALFPEYKDVQPGAPELITRDKNWVNAVLSRVHKSPISRIRTRQMDARADELRAHGYKKTDKKKDNGNMKLLKRTTDPQTIYVKDQLHRDDIIDITDFDVVDYQYRFMQELLREEIALDLLIGDGRDEGDEDKVSQEHVRSIWLDDDLYTIHTDVDVEAAKAKLQGAGTSTNFGDNYVYAEAIIEAALYAREEYRGSGNLDFYCTPHLLNVMLLARDRNGRRIYDSKSDLAKALNVSEIYTVEQLEGKVRTTKDSKKKKLLGIFVDVKDYRLGATKGGELTKFEDFDIDFNLYKYLLETRLSGALTKIYSAIALEEPMGE